MLVLDLLCEVNGKRVKHDRFSNEFKRTVLAESKELIKSKLETVICKEHQQRLRVEIVGSSSGEINVEIEGCCQRLIDDAVAKLKYSYNSAIM